MLSVDEAKRLILSGVTAVRAEVVPIGEADARVLANAEVARRDLPPWDNSAMDGFAVRAGELPGELPVAGTIAAGDAPDRVLGPGTVWRIMTGAPLPAGADAVVMREEVDDSGDRARFAEAARVGDNVRGRGEDVRAGDELVATGTLLGAGEIGLLAAQGCATLRVWGRPRVAVLSTGDELVDVDTDPGPGQIVNSNAYALAAQIREAGGIAVHAGIARDDLASLTDALRRAVASADVLVTSGGVSVGDFDHVKEAMAAAGVRIDFWKVAMKPGKPLAFGVAGDVPVFGLPGNPVSSMVVFELFVRPALLAMQGRTDTERPLAQVVATEPYRKQPGRAHYLRARVTRRGATLEAMLHPKQGSGNLSSMVGVDALVVVPADWSDVSVGDTLAAMLLRPA